MHPSTDPWVWFAAFLTLAIFSFLYRDNAFYKFAEHLFVGVSNGYLITLTWHNVLWPDLFVPIGQAFKKASSEGLSWSLFNPAESANFFMFLSGFVGALYILRFVPKLAWMVRIPIALVMGYSMAQAIPAYIEAIVIQQMKSTFLTRGDFAHWLPWTGGWGGSFKVLLFAGVFTTLVYFFFSKAHTGGLKVASRIGVVFIMIGFGATFALTVMGRVALAIGRFIFLFKDWLGLVH